MKLFILLLMLVTVQNVAAEATLNGVVVLRADSHVAGSGLFKEQTIDMEKTC